MKKTLSLFLLIGILFVTSPSFAFTNICEAAGKALEMTTAQMNEYYKDEIKTWTVEGNGKIYDIRIVKKKNCIITIKCENDVVAEIYAGKYWGSKKDLKVGQEMSFTGKCTGLTRQYYRNSDNTYIQADIHKPVLDY